MPTIKNDFCPEGVTAHMHAHPGIRYIGHDIAKAFRVKSSDMRMMLSELAQAGEISTSGDGSRKVYFVRSSAEIRAEQGIGQRPLLTVKPYRAVGAAWDRIRGQLADFRAIPSLHMERKQ